MKKAALLFGAAMLGVNAIAASFEKLDRGLVAVRSGNDVVVTWRSLGSDGKGAAYRVFRDDECLTPEPTISDPTSSTL